MEQVRRRLLVAAACAAASAAFRASSAPAKPKRVVLVDEPDAFRAEIRAVAVAGLSRHGLVEGRDYVYELVDVTGRNDELDQVARQVVGMSPAVIVVGSTVRTTAFMKATRAIPIVFFNVGDPVGSGLVASLARPGGNLTGVSNRGFELAAKEYETLVEVAPKVRRIAYLSFRIDNMHERTLAEIQAASRSRRGPEAVGIVVASTATSAEIAERLQYSGCGAVIFGFGRGDAGKEVFELLARARIASSVEYYDVARGGLLSLGEDIRDRMTRTFDVTARVLRGESPAVIPVDQLSRIRLALNMQTARAIGLQVPAAVLARFDEVIG